MPIVRWAPSLVLAVSVAGCSGATLAEKDPNGYEACVAIASIPTADSAIRAVLDANEAAERAGTASIREATTALETSDPEGGPRFIEELMQACEDEGFDGFD